MLFKIMDGTVSQGGETILSHIYFEIRGKEKLALVGGNGAGKTTLLRLIAGEISLDLDDKREGAGIYRSENFTIGFLHQNSIEDAEKTVEQLILDGCPYSDRYSKERYLYEMEYDRVFIKFGFSKNDKQRKIGTFSGGEQTRISLIRLLLQKPDLLLLDEPTNHLDLTAVEWLEQWLVQYDKAVLLVSHDRFFLDRVATGVYELADGKLIRYAGNYSAYREQRHKNYISMKKEYERAKEEEERLRQLIEKFKNKPKKAAFARSRKSMLQRMKHIPKPTEEEAHIFTGTIDPEYMSAKWVLEAKKLKIGYKKEEPVTEVSLRVKRGQKIGVIGANGTGKTTFVKTIAGLLEPLEGSYTVGDHTFQGYFDQQSAALISKQTVAEHFKQRFPGMTEKERYQTLANYLFRGSDTATCVSNLSGGEKARLVLCELLNSRPNLLLLDEPTNHMDIPAKETLESAFTVYTGTLIFISHDRYFIKQVADALLVFDEKGVYYYPFGYTHYIDKLQKSQGRDIAALVRAEDEAITAGFHAVPKKERHETRPMNTEEAYLDWKMRLAEEPLEEAEMQLADLWQKCQQMEMRDWESGNPGSLELKELQKEMELAWQEWTKACLDWYEATF